jgi:hypothetical protein
MNSAAWTAGQALPDQAFSKEDPLTTSVYPLNERICKADQDFGSESAASRAFSP